MAIYSKASIKSLSSQLDDRMERLKTVMNGYELHSDEALSYSVPDSVTRVIPSEIRVAVDDFNTILKEIKRVLK